MLSYTSAVIIALDATPLTLSTGGVGRYTWELALALAAEYPEDQYWLLSDQAFSVPGILPRNLHTGSGPQNPAERKWWLWGLEREMRRRGVELFHGTDYSVPYLRRRPSVMTLHDLSPWLNREWQPDASRAATARRPASRSSCRQAGGGGGVPADCVRISNPSGVTSTVCSHCADSE